MSKLPASPEHIGYPKEFKAGERHGFCFDGITLEFRVEDDFTCETPIELFEALMNGYAVDTSETVYPTALSRFFKRGKTVRHRYYMFGAPGFIRR